MYSCSAIVYTWGNNGLDQHVIANGKTEKGMLSSLRRYTSNMGKHSPYRDSTVVHLWYIGRGVYARHNLGDYKPVK